MKRYSLVWMILLSDCTPVDDASSSGCAHPGTLLTTSGSVASLFAALRSAGGGVAKPVAGRNLRATKSCVPTTQELGSSERPVPGGGTAQLTICANGLLMTRSSSFSAIATASASRSEVCDARVVESYAAMVAAPPPIRMAAATSASTIIEPASPRSHSVREVLEIRAIEEVQGASGAPGHRSVGAGHLQVQRDEPDIGGTRRRGPAPGGGGRSGSGGRLWEAHREALEVVAIGDAARDDDDAGRRAARVGGDGGAAGVPGAGAREADAGVANVCRDQGAAGAVLGHEEVERSSVLHRCGRCGADVLGHAQHRERTIVLRGQPAA